MTITLAWLRREMRLHDNAVLHAALSQTTAPLQPVFVFDSAILKAFPNPKDRRLSFIAKTLESMHAALKKQGGGLLVLCGDAQMLIPKLAALTNTAQLICAEDFEPATRKRDAAVAQELGQGRMSQVLDHLILPPRAVLKDDGTPYKVYTPFSRRWRERITPQAIAEKSVQLRGRLADYDALCALIDAEGTLKRLNAQSAEAMLEAAGYVQADLGQWSIDSARTRLEQFVLRQLDSYKDTRDFMASEGTSKLSPYLRFGLISARECYRLAIERTGRGTDCWQSELIWREFYTHILAHFPDSATLEFQEPYRRLNWEHDADKLMRWKEGKTGFPIVDAAMRELLEEGWMHNRARMIVASFLTKDLHQDWRLGEAHFAQHLMDYELASNVGGWQWAASTGTDAQPYFRIFNPELQSARFDPDGRYIRRYIPELRGLDAPQIHAPHKGRDLFSPLSYPEPMVDHHAEKEKAIARFKEAAA